METKRTVLVIGAAGFVGRHAIRHLVAEGHAVFATHIPGEAPQAVGGVKWIPSDLAMEGFSRDWPQRCDSVICLAQSQSWRVFPDGAPDVFRVNVAATYEAIEYARRAGSHHFVFASTGSIYTQTTRPARETDCLDLTASRNFYAASKLAAEALLRPYSALLSVAILRLFFPYGSGQNPSMLMPQLVRRVREGQPISLQGPDGLRMNPVAVADVARVLERCLEIDTSVTLNVGGPDVLTLRDIGTTIGKALDIEPRFEETPGQDAPVIVGDTSALSGALGWTPSTPFEIGLRDWLQMDQHQA